MKSGQFLIPRLTLAIVEITLIGLAMLDMKLASEPGRPRPAFAPTLGPSKKPLKTAPRQIAVRLNHAH